MGGLYPESRQLANANGRYLAPTNTDKRDLGMVSKHLCANSIYSVSSIVRRETPERPSFKGILARTWVSRCRGDGAMMVSLVSR